MAILGFSPELAALPLVGTAMICINYDADLKQPIIGIVSEEEWRNPLHTIRQEKDRG